MKTLIFNGSPRKNGDTSFLCKTLSDNLSGEVKVVYSFGSKISPCTDCRFCWKNVGCCIKDEMQEIYEDIKAADCIIIASPVYFSELTGTLLAMMSRLQTFYTSRRFLKVNQIEKPKIGGVILCGGGDGSPEKAVDTAKTLFKFMNTTLHTTIVSHNTDFLSAKDDENAIAQVKMLADFINSFDISL